LQAFFNSDAKRQILQFQANINVLKIRETLEQKRSAIVLYNRDQFIAAWAQGLSRLLRRNASTGKGPGLQGKRRAEKRSESSSISSVRKSTDCR